MNNPTGERLKELLREEEELNAMAPLAEENPTPYEIRAQNDPVARRLQAIAGAGNAYAFVVVDPTTDQTTVDYRGFYPEDLPILLRTVADLVGAEQ